MDTNKLAACKAYADAVEGLDYDNQAVMEKAMKERDLNWRGVWLDGGELASWVAKVVPGYNNWDGEIVSKLLKQFSQYEFALAREGSPALYVRGFKSIKEFTVFVEEFAKESEPDNIYIAKPNNDDFEWVILDENQHVDQEVVKAIEFKDWDQIELRMWWD